MSVHVISAVLKCRDKDLTSSRRMVLVCLGNYAGDDGHAWPSQQLIADESGMALRSVKDHIKWLDENGFISRSTKKLGQGNGSRTSYHISLQRLLGTPVDRGAKFAGAEFARANHGKPECGIPPFTNRQEPSLPNTDVLGDARKALPTKSEKPKRKAAPKGAARGSRIAPNWTPTPKDYAFASSAGLTREEINREADRFRNYWLAATKNAAKCDWEATWRNWLTGEFGIVTKKRAALDRGNAKGDASFAGIAASMEGHAPRPADPAWSDGPTIEGEFAYAPADAGHSQPQRGRGGDRADALPLLAAGQRRAG